MTKVNHYGQIYSGIEVNHNAKELQDGNQSVRGTETQDSQDDRILSVYLQLLPGSQP